jgi:hypothetical protein
VVTAATTAAPVLASSVLTPASTSTTQHRYDDAKSFHAINNMMTTNIQTISPHDSPPMIRGIRGIGRRGVTPAFSSLRASSIDPF